MKTAPTNYFFNYGNFDEEIMKKLDSLETPLNDLMRGIWVQPELRCLSRENKTRLDNLYRHLSSLPFDRIYSNYLSHPIRVTASYALVLGTTSYDDLALAMCHNLKEAGFLAEFDQENQFLNQSTKDRIMRLTIDRSREKNANYLKCYYDDIKAHSKNLMILKALDKLDNIFWWVAFDLDTYHANIVLDFVCPRIKKICPRLEEYLRTLVPYVLSPVVKEKFDKLNARNH